MSETRKHRRIPSALVCEAVAIVARGGSWHLAGVFLGPKLPKGLTVEQLRKEAVAHLERERTV